jgi:hypothetical protein
MPDRYLERAREADAQATRARNEEERQTFEEIAVIWRRLAANAGVYDTKIPEKAAGEGTD